VVALGVLVSGCGGGEPTGDPRAGSSPSAGKDHDMSGMAMSDMDERDGPSETARMVCEEDEIRDAVKRAFQMSDDPSSTHTWRRSGRLYACRWAVPQGTLRMTVQDATDPKAGRVYFDRLRGSLDDARPIRGMDNFGFPAFDTAAGDVVFTKDGKTLHVDATRLPGASLPAGFSRSEVAYSVASAVIACWTE
jgi:hypothetical protein